MSSLIILLVNIIEFPDHQDVTSDLNIIARVYYKFEQMNARASQEPFFLLTLAQQLHRRARGQIKRVAHLYTVMFEETMSGTSILSHPDIDLD